MSDGHHDFHGGGFALVVVLFILLIIIGTAFVGGYGYGGY
ncbi:YjcZ family sporulation protein [Bacillus swezeyi]|nr:YjcZ family sporulation protein [Bacillus swezeyi]